MSTLSKPVGPILVLLVICLFGQPAQAKYSGGIGEPNDPYQIATAEDLMLLGKTPADYNKHFILTADIDLDPRLPGRKVFDKAVIGHFTSVLDGNGHTISRLTITGGSYLGLFGSLASSAEVKDLGVVDVNVVGSGDCVGGLVGTNWAYGGLGGPVSGLIARCYSSGRVTGRSNVGGLVGWNYNGTVTNCYSTCSVSGEEDVGGLVGYNNGNITECYSNGMVTGSLDVGGLVGRTGSGFMRDLHGIVTECFWDTQTSGQATSAGGTGKTTVEMQMANTFLSWGCTPTVWTIDEGNDYPRLAWEGKSGKELPPLGAFIAGSGRQDDPYLISTGDDLNKVGLFLSEWDKHFKLIADIDMSAFDGKDGRSGFKIIGTGYENAFTGVFDGNGHTISDLIIAGEDCVGLFGCLGRNAEIKNLGVVDVNMTGSGSDVGGLVGYNLGTVTQCYGMGKVSGDRYVGGLGGMNYGTVTQCYSTATVSGEENVGGLLAYNSGTVTQCYSTGAASGGVRVGGLVSYNSGSITSSYSTGAVTGTGGTGWEVGGLVGYNYSGTVTGCFWDIQVSGRTRSAGGTGKTTVEMQMASTFTEAGWDFVGETANGTDDIWWILEEKDYPRLWWELVPQN